MCKLSSLFGITFIKYFTKYILEDILDLFKKRHKQCSLQQHIRLKWERYMKDKHDTAPVQG